MSGRDSEGADVAGHSRDSQDRPASIEHTSIDGIAGISRRDLLRYGALSIGAVGAASVLAACGSSGGGSGATNTAGNSTPGNSGTSPAGGGASGSGKALKVGLILPGAINDKSFNQVAYEGLKQAIGTVGGSMDYSENVSDTDAQQALRSFASRGYDVVIAHSFSYQDPTIDVAPDFPKTTFMVGTGTKNADNVGTYQNPDYQGAYLAGILAAGASKTGTLGWVGTLPTPNLLANFHAYEAGAKSYNPSAKVLHALIGSYYDPAKTKEAALAQIQLGADVIEEQSVGVIDAAIAQKVLAIGTIVDENSLGPKNVLTSVTWVLGHVYTAILNTVQDGSWTNKDWSYGVAEGSIALAPFHGLDNLVKADAVALQEKMLGEIKSGAFTVPRNVQSL
jgi:basic membrane protein A